MGLHPPTTGNSNVCAALCNGACWWRIIWVMMARRVSEGCSSTLDTPVTTEVLTDLNISIRCKCAPPTIWTSSKTVIERLKAN